MTTLLDKHIRTENFMKKFRIATPLGLVVVGCVMTAGFCFIGYCGDTAVRAVNMRFDSLDQKQDTMFRLISGMKDKENSDVLELSKGLWRCCGDKAGNIC